MLSRDGSSAVWARHDVASVRIPGILKARTGAHEVISTIMLNNIAILVSGYLVPTTLFRQPDRTDPVSKTVEGSAIFPRFILGLRVNTSLIMALTLAVVIFWLVERSTRGFELNAVGMNANPANSAGMDPNRTLIGAMTVGGALSGAAGAALIIAAPGLVRAIFRIKADDLATGQVAKGWGG
ncbi:MAG: ABC transporter permease [Nitriliruptor sp.]|nr:MAG: ABC transporter permease [Nitriliruptor sp.]